MGTIASMRIKLMKMENLTCSPVVLPACGWNLSGGSESEGTRPTAGVVISMFIASAGLSRDITRVAHQGLHQTTQEGVVLNQSSHLPCLSQELFWEAMADIHSATKQRPGYRFDELKALITEHMSSTSLQLHTVTEVKQAKPDVVQITTLRKTEDYQLPK